MNKPRKVTPEFMFSVSLPEIEFGSVFAGPDSKHQTQNATLFSLIQYIK